jgi:hypothetical protein
MLSDMLRAVVLYFGLCFILAYMFTIIRPSIMRHEGFADTKGEKNLPDLPPCDKIPLSEFNKDAVMIQIPPDIQYAISNYSVGALNYLPKIQKAFNEATVSTQMAISALLARYLALNGGSAGTAGPGFTNTSPGNYVAQLSGAKELLNPPSIDKTSSVYPSFRAANAVAMCSTLNTSWVSTADF